MRRVSPESRQMQVRIMSKPLIGRSGPTNSMAKWANNAWRDRGNCIGTEVCFVGVVITNERMIWVALSGKQGSSNVGG